MAAHARRKTQSKALRGNKKKTSSAAKPKTVAKRAKPKSRARNGGLFETGLACNPANFASLTPLSFLARSADIHPERIAVVHGDRRVVLVDPPHRQRRRQGYARLVRYARHDRHRDRDPLRAR